MQVPSRRHLTPRLWAGSEAVPVTWAERECRSSSGVVDALGARRGQAADRPRREGLCVRVSGTTGQQLSLEAQAAELPATATGKAARVFRDRASGLREDRPGQEKMLQAAADGQATVARVTHEDRLARLGAGRLRRLPARAATVEVPQPKAQGGREEPRENRISLAIAFASRLYGMWSAAARSRLLAGSGRCQPGGAR